MILSATTNNKLKRFIGSEFKMLSICDMAMFAPVSDKDQGFRTSKVKSIKADSDTIIFETENSTYKFNLEKGENFNGRAVIHI